MSVDAESLCPEPRSVASISPWLAAVVQRNREAAGLSQEELADLADVHRTYVSLVERGKRNPSVVSR